MAELLSSLEYANIGLVVVPVKIWGQDDLVLTAGGWINPVLLPGLSLSEWNTLSPLLDCFPNDWDLFLGGLHELVRWTLSCGGHNRRCC